MQRVRRRVKTADGQKDKMVLSGPNEGSDETIYVEVVELYVETYARFAARFSRQL